MKQRVKKKKVFSFLSFSLKKKENKQIKMAGVAKW